MAPSPAMKSSVRAYFPYMTALFFLLGAVFAVCSWTLPAGSSGGMATYSHGTLQLAIPYQAEHGGKGQLTVEVLDPEDRVLGRTEKSVDVTQGSAEWKQQVRLEKVVAIEDLVWHRVRYRFHYEDGGFADLEGTESISTMLRMPLLHILGQQTYLAGSKAAVRVIVTDGHQQTISGRGSLRIDLQGQGQERTTLFRGQLNRRNTTEAQFQFPAGLSGNYELHYVADTSIGSTEFTQPIQLFEKVGILLTTEKPIYQPGQTIHARALALDRADHEAVANRGGAGSSHRLLY